MIELKETKFVSSPAGTYLRLDIFNLPKGTHNDGQIFEWLIHSKYYQWNYQYEPDGFIGNIIHGPFLISKIEVSDYIEVSLDQMLFGINNTIWNEIYYHDNDEKKQNANRQFRREVDDLLNNITKDCLCYYHLNLELSTEDESLNTYDKMADAYPYSFFNSYVGIAETKFFLIELGDA